MVETGIVTRFVSTRGFGWIEAQADGEEIFFRFGQGRFIVAGVEKPEFTDQPPSDRTARLQRLRSPMEGDRIVFERGEGEIGPVAKKWGYLSAWKTAEVLIAERVKKGGKGG